MRDQSALDHEALREVMAQATKPFVYAQLAHSEPDSVFPTLQGSCRVLSARLDPAAILPQLVESQRQLHPSLELLEATADAIVGGNSAIKLRMRFDLSNFEGTVFDCLAHSYTVFCFPLAFSIGLSCADEGAYFVPDTLDAIARSIRIDRQAH